MLYILGIAFSFVVHDHHAHGVISYQTANSCERTIYYAEQNHNCAHNSHITDADEECWLCSKHITSPHHISGTIGHTPAAFYSESFIPIPRKFLAQTPSTLSNRGPPAV